MKRKLFLTIGVLCALLGFVQAAQYDFYGYTTLISGTTNNVGTGTAGVAATNYYSHLGPIVTTRAEYLPIQVKYNFHTAPGGTVPSVKFLLKRSVDGSSWETNAFHTLLANGATNNCVWATNLTAAGMAYYQLYSIENTNDAVLTNIVFIYGTKR